MRGTWCSQLEPESLEGLPTAVAAGPEPDLRDAQLEQGTRPAKWKIDDPSRVSLSFLASHTITTVPYQETGQTPKRVNCIFLYNYWTVLSDFLTNV